ncbi:MAG TPA: tannase/feruloyl esterase family alpha/beta hydrolase [Candidatus Dormibacteraeota bacterium]|nr:tannase/feruloyl esterase family alpha/beta hydrolase [Candidatus Dormibacteraeota bacterium]
MKRLKNIARCAAGFFLCAAVSGLGQPAARAQTSKTPAESCANLTSLRIPGVAMTITKAMVVPAAAAGTIRAAPFQPPIPVAIPAYCRADGEIDPRTGVDGKSYAIRFSIALPEKWNGRFLFQGGGGLDGSVGMPLGATAAGDDPALARGFAVVSNDSGHEGAVFDASFMKDQQAALDFAYKAIGKVTPVAKQIIAQYYGEPAAHSYFVGCSTGGREAMLVSERYPTYFNGVVAGDPAMRTDNSNAGDAWAAVAFNAAAPKDASGKPETGKLFSASDRKLLIDSILGECDAKDGLKDGMIFNFQACHYNPAVLQCSGAKTDACLSAVQVGALQKAFSPLKDSLGNVIYPAFPFDSGVAAAPPQVMVSGLVPSGTPASPFGPDLATTYDPDKVEATIAADGEKRLADTYYWTNLSTFSGRGGKLLFYHGLSDPWFSPLDTLGYYKNMASANGGLDQVENWSRIYLVPGMSHCGGGPATLDNFDMLSAVVNWVEKGTPPDSVIATGKDFPGRSRPLCAYPKHAQYKGSGDPQDASNFVCGD